MSSFDKIISTSNISYINFIFLNHNFNFWGYLIFSNIVSKTYQINLQKSSSHVIIKPISIHISHLVTIKSELVPSTMKGSYKYIFNKYSLDIFCKKLSYYFAQKQKGYMNVRRWLVRFKIRTSAPNHEYIKHLLYSVLLELCLLLEKACYFLFSNTLCST